MSSMATEAREVLGEELRGYIPELGELTEKLFDANTSDEARARAANHYTTYLRRLSLSASMLDVEGVSSITEFAERNVSALSASQDHFENGELKKLVSGWPLSLEHTLTGNGPGNEDDSQGLLSTITRSVWPQPIDQDDLKLISDELGLQFDINVTAPSDDREQPTDIESELEDSIATAPDALTADGETSLADTAVELAQFDFAPAVEVTETILDKTSESSAELTDQASTSDTSEIEIDIEDFTIPAGANDFVIEAFMEEVSERAADFSSSVQRLANGDAVEENLESARRVAHTVKGSAAIAGVKGMSSLMHLSEDILESLAESKTKPEPEIAGLLVDTADCLEEMVESLQTRSGPPANVGQVMQRLTNWRSSDDTSDQAETTETKTSSSVELADKLDGALSDSTSTLTSDVPEIVSAQESDTTTEPAEEVRSESFGTTPLPASNVVPAASRSQISSVDELLRFAGEVSISTVQLQGFQTNLQERLKAVVEQNSLVQQRMDDLNELIHIRGVPAARQAFVAGDIGEQDFDPLELDQYNELHSFSNALSETLVDSSEMSKSIMREISRLGDLVALQQRTSKDLTDTVLDARLVPIASIAPRMQRAVRQTCRTTGKQAELFLAGSQLQVDSEILNQLTDGLLHMLRNAVDHGIEPPEHRVAGGKSRTGTITLSFEQVGDLLNIECSDDGRGFDFEAIRDTAISSGLASRDQELSEEDLVRFTWLPGFSTQETTTEVSGRGIGANVVHQLVTQNRGAVSVKSEKGLGATVAIKLPLTVISVHTMLVEVGDQQYGVPSTSVEQMIFSDAGVVKSGPDHWEFEFEDQSYRIEFLGKLLGQEYEPLEAMRQQSLPLFIVRSDIGDVAVVFDRAIDGRPLVIKKLGEYLPRVRGVAGATILADGSIASILDIRELVEDRDRLDEQTPVNLVQNIVPTVAQGHVLVVDDSLSARRAMAQMVSDAGYEVETAIDGLDAVEKIEDTKPTAVLLDMEMPRMTGLEVAQHMRTHDETRNIPIIMITSRSTEKHRQQAMQVGVNMFVTKPYSELEVTEALDKFVKA